MGTTADRKASNFYDPQRDAYGNTNANRAQGQTGWDPNAKRYGGSQEASDAAAYDRSAEADRALEREGVKVDYSKANRMGQYAQSSRNQQLEASGLMRARATGEAPSIAQMQADRQMQQARAAQSSMAAGARGAAGIAMAQQQAAGNTATSQQQISGQAQIAAAQERLAAEQAYFGASSGMRGQDLGAMGQYAQMGQAQAQFDAQQRAANDARSMFYDQGAWQVADRNQQAAMQEQGILSGAHGAADSQNMASDRQNAEQGFGWKDAMSLAGSVAGAASFLSDVRAKTDVQPLGSPDRDPGMGIVVPVADGNAQALSGYANERKGKPGALFNDAPKAAGPQLAPGTADYMHAMGGDASLNGTGQDAAQQKQKESGIGSVNLANALRMLSDVRAKENVGPIMPDPMTSSLAQMRPYAYTYKGDPTRDRNVGPMAQDMASNPITGTAVMPDPSTGMLAIDRDKALKLSLGGVGHLAAKQEEMDRKLAGLARAKGGKR
jgi:hypothetical protein